MKNFIKEDEMLYVYSKSKPVFKYKNGYHSNKTGNVKFNNIIWGQGLSQWHGDTIKTTHVPDVNFQNNKNSTEFEKILEHKKVYLLFSHYSIGIDFGLHYLEQHGSLTKVLDIYDTPLFYFTRNEEVNY